MSEASYREPGVYVREIRDNVIPAATANDNVVAIVSNVPTNRVYAEDIVLTGTGAVELSKAGVVPASIVVTDLEGGTTYLGATDYTVASTDPDPYGAYQSLTRADLSATESFTLSANDDVYNPLIGRGVHDIEVRSGVGGAVLHTELVDWIYDPYSNRLKALSTGNIPRDGSSITVTYSYGIESGERVTVSYRYADADYYQPFHTARIAEVRERFGEAWDASNNLNPMTLAAEFVFSNGGSNTQIRCVPVDPNATGSKTVASEVDWQIAIQSVNQRDTAMVVETSGLIEIQGYLLAHVRSEHAENVSMIAFVGRDGTLDPTTRTSLRAYGQALNDERIVLVSTERADSLVYTRGTYDGKVKAIGTQYLAAALTGLLSSRRPEEGLTRLQVAGLTTRGKAPNAFLRSDTTYGLCVVEENGPLLRVRHGITTAFSDINTAEISVVRAKDFMIKQMREALDRTVIGRPMDPNLDFAVGGAAANILDRMRTANVISEYSQPNVSVDPNDPTQLFLEFEYWPNYPLNKILIRFRISKQGAQSLV